MTLAAAAALILVVLCPPAGAQNACTYTMTKPVVSGPCPPGESASGSCTIDGRPDSFFLTLTSGAVCRPPTTCKYTCQPVADGYRCGNTALVDDEGGRVNNTMELETDAGGVYRGAVSSEYVHPSGFTCEWVSRIEIVGTFPGD
jgi:hypothetical protein